jgi:hypothetical protein
VHRDRALSKIFISHSSRDNFEAQALADWLAENGWSEVFLDLDPERGIAAGERWERRLHEASQRCEAVIFLVSEKSSPGSESRRCRRNLPGRAGDRPLRRPWREGDIFQIACAWVPDHDLTDIARDYGLTNLEPICEGDPPLPDGAGK